MGRTINERTVNARESLEDRDDRAVVRKKANLRHRVFLSPLVKYGVPALVAAAIVTSVVRLSTYLVPGKTENVWKSTCNVRASYRVDCFPGKPSVSYEECGAVDCCWREEDRSCFHSIPSAHGYRNTSDSDTVQENDVFAPRRETSPFGRKNAGSLRLRLKKQSDPNRVGFVLRIGRASPPEERSNDGNESTGGRGARDRDSSEVSFEFSPDEPARRASNVQTDPRSNMDVYVHTPEFSVTVTRKNDTSRPLLSTARGPLILTENFWELTLWLTNGTLYGLNRQELNGTTNWIYDNENGTSRLGFLGVDSNGEATACRVGYDGPAEIEVMDESNLVVLRGLSLPDEISFDAFRGDSPLEAVERLTLALGDRDSVQLSDLGLHVCPSDDSDESAVDSIAELVEALADTPWDSHCLGEGFAPTLGTLVDPSTIERCATLLTNGGEATRAIHPHLSPMVFADNDLWSGLNDDSSLLRTSRGSYRAYLASFRRPRLVYVRDSWPRDESETRETPGDAAFDYAPSVLRNSMGRGTLPRALTASSRGVPHYAEHGSYSSDFVDFVREGSSGESTSLVIRGLWGESGNSSWSALRAAIESGVGAGIVGQLPSPMYACGTAKNSAPTGLNDDQLCSRWFGASVAWPRVLALPTNLPGGKRLNGVSESHVKRHLRLRASLVTYARTALARYYREGSPVLAPTFLHFPEEPETRRRWNQFVWGSDLLVGVATLPGVSQVSMRIPGPYAWRHLETGVRVGGANGASEDVPITATEGRIVALIRPGSKISMTSSSTLKSDLTLLANLPSDDGSASGRVFYGSRANGAFLTINATRASVTFGNALAVKERACGADGTREQGTRIDEIELFGHSTMELDLDLCAITEDSFGRP